MALCLCVTVHTWTQTPKEAIHVRPPCSQEDMQLLWVPWFGDREPSSGPLQEQYMLSLQSQAVHFKLSNSKGYIKKADSEIIFTCLVGELQVVVGKEVGAHSTGVTKGFWAESIKVNNTHALWPAWHLPSKDIIHGCKRSRYKDVAFILGW